MTAKRSEMTAYRKKQVDDKKDAVKKERRKKKPSKAEARTDGLCGAKKRKGGICRQPAGLGTTHPGIGKCKFHGGHLPTHVAHAAKQQAIFLGAPKDINPVEAMMWCIRITAGEVEWFTEQLHEIESTDWYEDTALGRQLHVLARARGDAINRLAKYSKDAIGLGIAERAVRIAELYGTSIAKLMKGVLEDLELTPKQRDAAPAIIRKHLILLEQGTLTGEMKQQHPVIEHGQPQLPERVKAA